MVTATKAKGKTKGNTQTHDEQGQPTGVPESVVLRIGPVDYEIFLFNGLLKYGDGRGLCYGMANLGLCQIFISDVIPIRKRIATFWHEFMHVVFDECSCVEPVSKMEEEDLCNLLGIGMANIGASEIARVYKLLSNERGSVMPDPSDARKKKFKMRGA